MTFEFLEINLSNFKRLLPFWFGAALTILAVAIVDMPNSHSPYYAGWYGVWLFIQIGTLLPSLIILFAAGFRKLPFSERFTTIYLYLFLSWISLIALVVKSSMFFPSNIPTYIGFSNGIGISISLPQLFIFLGLIGLSIPITYWILFRKYIRSPEAMFP